MTDRDPRRVARGDLAVDVGDDGPESYGGVPAGQGDHDFVEQEAELKTNTEPTREIHVLLTELDRHLADGR